MARVIICDRCAKKIPGEEDIFKVSFARPKTTNDSNTHVETCKSCFDYTFKAINTPPPEEYKFKPGD